MRKILSYAALLAAIVVVACSVDEELSSQAKVEDDGSIGFATYLPKITKATAITNDTFTETDFEVYGFFVDGEQIMGVEDLGVQFVATDGVWDYADADEKVYWSENEMDFLAISPAQSAEDYVTVSAQNSTISLSYTVPTDNADQVDLLYAEIFGVSSTDRDGTGNNVSTGSVELDFAHLLTQITFDVSTLDESLDVVVSEIALCNIVQSGTYSIDISSGEGLWTLSDDSEQEEYGLGSEESLMLIPQTLTPWETVVGTPVAIADTENAYIAISCTIYNEATDTYIVGSEDGDGIVYIPFGGTWSAGQSYNYSFIFGQSSVSDGGDGGESGNDSTGASGGGAGFDADGNPILYDLVINFTPTISVDWVEQSGDATM
ncbi:MAG: fimbrillin family protein [Rikenellaceae bacterium]